MGSNGLAFKEWAASEGCVANSQIEDLRGGIVGIDADDYLEYLLLKGSPRSPGCPEPLLPAHGGLPFTFTERIDSDLQNFQEAGITPGFVFSGLDLASKDRASILKEARKASSALSDAWNFYEAQKSEEVIGPFGRACTYRSYHIVRFLRDYLHHRGVEVQTAPYSAAAQLAYMDRTSFTSATMGSASCLAHGIDHVITEFNWESKTFSWIMVQKCLTKLDLNREQFVHLCLLSGSSILPTLPEVDTDASVSKMQAARSAMSRCNNDVDAVCRKSSDPNYHLLFHKARFALKHPVILDREGRVEPVNWQSGPSDTHEFIGQRLPEEIYFYMSRGVIGPRVLNWRTRMEIVETAPLDGGNSQTYKDLVQDKLRPLRVKALTLLTRLLTRYYHNKDVALVCWWNENNQTPLGVKEMTDPIKATESWHVKASQMPQLADTNSETTPLLYAITSLSKDPEAKRTVTPRPSTAGTLREVKAIRANIIWRFFQDRDYINSDHTLSAWGKVLKAAFERATSMGLMSQEETRIETEELILMAFELLRLDALSTKQMFPQPPYTGGPIRGSETDKGNTLLISRIACLGTLKHKVIGYTGPLSRHLLAYHQMAATVRGTLRDLIEMHACHLLCTGAVDRRIDSTAYNELGASLPLLNEPNLGLALVVKCYLDELSQPLDKKQDYRKWFVHAVDLDGDLERTWKLWDVVNAGVQAAENAIVNTETKKMFTNADEWLKARLEHANAPNGTA